MKPMKIKGSFLDKFLSTDLKLSDIEPYFSNYNESDWEYQNSGYFSLEFEKGEIILYFVNCIDYGICFHYSYKPSNNKESAMWYSVGNEILMNEIIDANDAYFVPKGSCLNNETAWKVLSDFFKNPLEKPNIIKWVNEDDIDWSSVKFFW